MTRTEYLAEKAWRFRKMARMLAKLVDVSKSEDTFERASKSCVCDHCGLEFIDHPQLENVLFLLCDGSFVKL